MRSWWSVSVIALLLSLPLFLRGGQHSQLKPEFQTSDRCVACHNGLTKDGKDISIGIDWRVEHHGATPPAIPTGKAACAAKASTIRR